VVPASGSNKKENLKTQLYEVVKFVSLDLRFCLGSLMNDIKHHITKTIVEGKQLK